MLNDIKNASKHSIVYGVGNIAPKVIGLILIPLYTNPQYLSQADYGALAVLEAASQLLIGILTLSMVQGLTRWYWDEKYIREQKSIFFTTIAFLIAVIIPFSAALILLSGPISVLLFKSASFTFLVQLSIITAGLTIINRQILCLVKLQSRSILYSATTVAKFILILGFTLYGILILGRGLEAIWVAYVLGEALMLLAMIPYSYKNSAFRFNSVVLKEMLIYGLPLIFASASSVILVVTDRFMLNSLSGLEQTGVYSLGLRIANTLKLVLTSTFALALSPVMMKKMSQPDNTRFYAKINTYTAFVFILALLILSLFSLEFLKIFTGSVSYWAANGVIPILAFAFFFGLLKQNVTIGLSIKKKTRVLGTIIFIGSLLNIGLNILLIQFLDIYGAALATLLSQLFLFVAVYLSAQRFFPVPYEMKKIFFLILVSTVIIVAGLLTSEINVWIRVSIKMLMLILFPFVLYLFNFYEQKEWETIIQIGKTWFNPRKLRNNLNRFLNASQD